MKSWIRKVFRRAGWEVQRVATANQEHQVLKDILRLTGVDVVLDVGANVGQFGELVLSTGFNGTLVSFEAIPDVHRNLSAHVAGRNRPAWIVAPCAALGRERGSLEINVSANSVSSSLLPMRRMHVDAAPESRYIRKEVVAIERLDQISAPLISPSSKLLIKIDTQGYEREVLLGATQLLPRTAAVQLELSLVPLYEGAPGLVEMISFMESQGFDLFGLVPGFKDRSSGRLLQMDGFFVRAVSGEARGT